MPRTLPNRLRDCNTLPVIYRCGNDMHHELMDAKTARTMNIRALVAREGGPTKFAAKSGDWSQAQVSQWISETNPKGIGHALARAVERALGLPLGWMDQPHGTVHIGVATTAVETVTVGPLSHAPNPALLTRAITEAAAAFRRSRRLPTDESLARVAVLAYQILSAGQALAASRRALDEAMQKAVTEEPIFQQE